MSGQSSKRKGSGYERELVKQARDSGIAAERAYASNGRSLGFHEEVDLTVAHLRIQAKRRKDMEPWEFRQMMDLATVDHLDAVACRSDGGQTTVTLDWWTFLDLVKGKQDDPEAER